jgi:hypothetical protein
MHDLWSKLTDDPLTAIVALICATILGCALVFGGVSCVRAEYEYKIKKQELQNQGSKEFFNKER